MGHFPIRDQSSHAIILSTTASNLVAMNRLRRLNRQERPYRLEWDWYRKAAAILLYEHLSLLQR
jgi:hypothetical protein